MMCSSVESCDNSSPTCVSQELQRIQHMPDLSVPCLPLSTEGTTPAAPTIAERKRPQRSVHFKPANENLQVSRPSTSQVEGSDTYWFSCDELDKLKTQARNRAVQFRQGNAALYSKNFADVFRLCSSQGPSQVQGILSKESTRSLLQSLEKSDLRGLEDYMHPIVKYHRRRHIQTVLVAQAKALPKDAGPDTRQLMMRLTSMRSSRPSRAIARLLAHGDALEVIALLREELNTL